MIQCVNITPPWPPPTPPPPTMLQRGGAEGAEFEWKFVAIVDVSCREQEEESEGHLSFYEFVSSDPFFLFISHFIISKIIFVSFLYLVSERWSYFHWVFISFHHFVSLFKSCGRITFRFALFSDWLEMYSSARFDYSLDSIYSDFYPVRCGRRCLKKKIFFFFTPFIIGNHRRLN